MTASEAVAPEPASMDRWRNRAFGLSVLAALALLFALPQAGIGLGTAALAAVAVMGGGGALTLRASLDRLDDAKRRQRTRSIAIAGILFGLVVLFYAATIVRLGPNALRRETPVSGQSKPAMTDSCKRAGSC